MTKKIIYSLANIAIGSLIISGLAACGGSSEDPSAVYEEVTKAATSGNAEALYDRFDTNLRNRIDQMMEMQKKNKDQAPPEEKAFIDSIQNLKGKEAFVKLFKLNKNKMETPFKGKYKILSQDKYVILSTQHEGSNPDLFYFREVDGKLKVSAPPSPQQGMQQQPPQGMQQPPQGMQQPPQGMQKTPQGMPQQQEPSKQEMPKGEPKAEKKGK